MTSLQHEEHLTTAEKPFTNNPLYSPTDSLYLTRLIGTLEPRVKLTKTEYLVLVNQRPYRRRHMTGMIEDIDSRFSIEDQNFIRDTVVKVLGIKEGVAGNADEKDVDIVEPREG